VDDTNYYTFVPVDVTNEEKKNLVSDFFCWESLTGWGGLGEFVDGKVWGC